MPADPRPTGRGMPRALGATAAAGAAGLGWSLVEARSFRLRRVQVPVLPAGQRPLRVLHLSDLHLTPGQHRKREWLRWLGALAPDLVVDTGDNLAHRDAVPTVLDALGPLLDVPGAFVPGSNDYYAPVPKNPARYLLPDARDGLPTGPRLPWEELASALRSAGWVDLTNAAAHVRLADGRRVALAGTDDPHLDLDDLAGIPPADRTADLALGVSHAPYLRVLDAFVAAGYPLVLAGHTHGGQLCVPGWGALVTNCDLDTRRAKGLSTHPAAGGPGSSWLHVSAGLGTSPWTPVRFACRPEATLLTLVPARS